MFVGDGVSVGTAVSIAVAEGIAVSVGLFATSTTAVGVSTNVIDASYAALHDAITYKLFVDGAETAR